HVSAPMKRRLDMPQMIRPGAPGELCCHDVAALFVVLALGTVGALPQGSVAPAGCWSEAQHPRRERRVRRVQRRVFEGLGRHRGSDRARRGDDVRGRPEGAARDLSRALHAEEDQRGPGQVPGLRGRRRRRGGVGPG
ncbi:unnamed protein product, partial [Prorocentrum cordatum]